MQKPFPELINEPGETGRGQSRQPCPHPRHDTPRHGAGGDSERRLCPDGLRPRALPPGRPPAAPRSGNFCGRGAAGKDTAAAGPTCADGTGPPAARSPAAGGGVAALTCSRRSSRKPSLTELHLPPARRGKGGRESTQRCRPPPPQPPLSVSAVPRPRCPAQRPPLARPADGTGRRKARPTSHRRLLLMKSPAAGPSLPWLPAAARRAALRPAPPPRQPRRAPGTALPGPPAAPPPSSLLGAPGGCWRQSTARNGSSPLHHERSSAPRWMSRGRGRWEALLPFRAHPPSGNHHARFCPLQSGVRYRKLLL